MATSKLKSMVREEDKGYLKYLRRRVEQEEVARLEAIDQLVTTNAGIAAIDTELSFLKGLIRRLEETIAEAAEDTIMERFQG